MLFRNDRLDQYWCVIFDVLCSDWLIQNMQGQRSCVCSVRGQKSSCRTARILFCVDQIFLCNRCNIDIAFVLNINWDLVLDVVFWSVKLSLICFSFNRCNFLNGSIKRDIFSSFDLFACVCPIKRIQYFLKDCFCYIKTERYGLMLIS